MPQSETWFVLGDAARLEQVILNLLENAIKYSPKGDDIRVQLQPGNLSKEASVELTITDSGIGLNSDELNHIFERYYRAPRTQQEVNSLGLGLYISNEIIVEHKGRLWATSLAWD